MPLPWQLLLTSTILVVHEDPVNYVELKIIAIPIQKIGRTTKLAKVSGISFNRLVDTYNLTSHYIYRILKNSIMI
jgi:hypothetical protein